MENTACGAGSSNKYSMRQSQVLYLSRDPTPSAVFFCASQVNSTLNDLLFYIGGLSVLFHSTLISMLLDNLRLHICLIATQWCI